ncbi:MAG: pirin family protein [SAR202 cluster bacterium]|nr:pirin family protein [SAR202 cluster bacterium]
MATTIDIRRADGRLVTRTGWLESHHSFNFGGARREGDDQTHFGLLLVSNDDTVQPASGFGTHGHRDMEIVTWVLDGELEHRGSTGTQGVIHPGLAQKMSAGRGIRHSEMNLDTARPVHFVQMWVPPDTDGIEPGYEQRDAVLWGGRLPAGGRDTVPDAPFVHVFVARGRWWRGRRAPSCWRGRCTRSCASPEPAARGVQAGPGVGQSMARGARRRPAVSLASSPNSPNATSVSRAVARNAAA